MRLGCFLGSSVEPSLKVPTWHRLFGPVQLNHRLRISDLRSGRRGVNYDLELPSTSTMAFAMLCGLE